MTIAKKSMAHDTSIGSMNRSDSGSRCRWLGETPAIVVWRLVYPCPILDNFARFYRSPQTPVAIQQCFKPLEAISEATQLHNIHDDWAVILPEDQRIPGNFRDQPLAFSISESLQVFGGKQATIDACRHCPVNVRRFPAATVSPEPSLAGCSQVLVVGSLSQLSDSTRVLSDAAKPLAKKVWNTTGAEEQWKLIDPLAETIFAGGQLRQMLRASTPRELWQRMWFSSGSVISWNAARIAALVEDMKIGSHHTPQSDSESLTGWALLRSAVTVASEHGVTLETEYIPRGFADGRDWWLSPHCSHCGADMASVTGPAGSESRHDVRHCLVCGRDGGPVPEQKRRIMGWAPYRPLSSLLDKEAADRLVETASVQLGANG